MTSYQLRDYIDLHRVSELKILKEMRKKKKIAIAKMLTFEPNILILMLCFNYTTTL